MNCTDTLIANARPLADGLAITPGGEIDFTRSPAFRSQLLQLIQQHKPGRLVIDLHQVPYMDSSGVAALIEMLSVMWKHEGRLVLCRLQPKVLSLFQIARLELMFTIVGDVDEAIRA